MHILHSFEVGFFPLFLVLIFGFEVEIEVDSDFTALALPIAATGFSLRPPIGSSPALRIMPARGGKVTVREYGLFIHGCSSAINDPGALTTLLPPKKSASELSNSW